MQTPVTLPIVVPRRMRMMLEVGWAVIIAKCLAVPWVIAHWQIPVHPGWVIVPTLLFAALVTLVVFAWRDE
ncbi:MAG TPA: hypothetical protein VLW52_06465 [Opitutaceae bacterium]|nr:hypothetical protein [Opitutaceae bacterium]